MSDRQRFSAAMSYRPMDRLPAYYFGQWGQTLDRWRKEGLREDLPLTDQVGLDPDWERGLWDCHGLSSIRAIHHGTTTLIEDAQTYRVVRHPDGSITRESKIGECIAQHLKEALEPTREAWNSFKKTLDPDLPERRIDPAKLAATAADYNNSGRTICFLGASLFGWPREWIGIEAISMLPYDDPALYQEIIETQADLAMRVLDPILDAIHVDLIYIFEDCCGKSGPLFSPSTYRQFYHRHYCRLVSFYKSKGVRHILLDSDGDCDLLIACWLESGIDIVFPIEVGTWKADPIRLRRKFGRQLRMMGGFDKHLITRGESAVREELKRLKPLADEGGFIPLPDHRIPPDCSLEQFRAYARVFREVMG